MNQEDFATVKSAPAKSLAARLYFFFFPLRGVPMGSGGVKQIRPRRLLGWRVR